MKHIYSVLCEKSSIDQESNTASLLSCLEQVEIFIDKSKASKLSKISIPIKFQLYSLWGLKKDENKLRSKLEIIDPDDKVLHSIEHELPIKEGVKKFRSRLNFNGLPITKEGTYIFRLFYKDNKDYKKASESPLDIKITASPGQVNLKPKTK